MCSYVTFLVTMLMCFTLFFSLVAPAMNHAVEHDNDAAKRRKALIDAEECIEAIEYQPSILDITTVYAQHFGRVKVIPNKAQLELLYQVKERKVEGGVLVSTTEEAELLSRIAERNIVAGTTISEKTYTGFLIKVTYPLVFKFAREQHAKHPNVPLDDLVQWGMIALLKAIEQYSSDSDYKIAAYLKNHMRNEIRGGMYGGMHIYEEAFTAPTRDRSYYYRVAKIYSALLAERHGSAITAEEVFTLYEKEMLRDGNKLGRINLEDVRDMILLYKMARAARMSITVTDKDDDSDAPDHLHEISESQIGESSAELAIAMGQHTVTALFKKLADIAGLDPREKKFLSLFFGVSLMNDNELPENFDHNEPYSLSQIAKIADVSFQRVQEIKNRALKKLLNKTGIGDWAKAYAMKPGPERDRALALNSGILRSKGISVDDARSLVDIAHFGIDDD